MSKWVKRVIAMTAAVTAVPSAAQDVVAVQEGMVRGVTAGGVTSFKGIAYAAPPVNELRWQPPQPPKPRAGVQLANAFGPACMQSIPEGFEHIFKPAAASEDCLTLNVWKPATAKPGARLPVMVYIYGGGFKFGTSETPFYDGTSFAQDGVVMVSFNYRVGLLGFFSHPSLDQEPGPHGNYGLMDQIAALKWVKANIANFGGDPANVTIFGQSAGGISVNALMVSPAARGLFDKAIAHSSFAGTPLPQIRGGPESAEAVGIRAADSMGIRGSDARAAAALRALPADKIVAQTDDPALVVRPMIDGTILPEQVVEAFAAGREAPVPYITGGTGLDGAILAPNPEAAVGPPGPRRDKLLAVYGSSDLSLTGGRVVTDKLMTEPVRFVTRAHARTGAPAYAYYFDYVPVANRNTEHGAAHGAELFYVFKKLPDYLTISKPAPPTPDDWKMADAMHAYWVNFARTGNPGVIGGVTWPRVTEEGGEFLVIDNEGIAARQAFARERLDVVTSPD